jgi:nucleotide-binding universal stress UspA family protein
MLRTILVPLDGSELAARALTCATALSRRMGARLLLVRTVEVGDLADVDVSGSNARAIGSAERYLMDLASDIRALGFACDIAVPTGRAAEGVLLEAQRGHADLIVLTSHGRTGPGRWLFGSVAEAIVAETEVPVLVERAGKDGAPDFFLSTNPRLLVPLDGSPFAEASVEPAAQLAIDLAGELELVHVAERPADVAADRDGNIVGYVDQLEDSLRTRSLDYLDAVRRRLADQWPPLTVHTSFRFGEPQAQLSAAAADSHAALIVMATHGLTGLRRSMVGSVAGRVLEHSSVPVVLVHSAAERSETETKEHGPADVAPRVPLS